MERETSQLLNKSNKNCKTWADAIKYQEKLPDAGRRYGIWGGGGWEKYPPKTVYPSWDSLEYNPCRQV